MSLFSSALSSGGTSVSLMAAVWVMFGVWAGWAATARVALVFYTLLLAALTVRSGWQLAQEWAADGVRINTVLPGLLRTTLTEAIYADPQKKATREALVPMAEKARALARPRAAARVADELERRGARNTPASKPHLSGPAERPADRARDPRRGSPPPYDTRARGYSAARANRLP